MLISIWAVEIMQCIFTGHEKTQIKKMFILELFQIMEKMCNKNNFKVCTLQTKLLKISISRELLMHICETPTF